MTHMRFWGTQGRIMCAGLWKRMFPALNQGTVVGPVVQWKPAQVCCSEPELSRLFSSNALGHAQKTGQHVWHRFAHRHGGSQGYDRGLSGEGNNGLRRGLLDLLNYEGLSVYWPQWAESKEKVGKGEEFSGTWGAVCQKEIVLVMDKFREWSCWCMTEVGWSWRTAGNKIMNLYSWGNWWVPSMNFEVVRKWWWGMRMWRKITNQVLYSFRKMEVGLMRVQ